MKRLSFLVLGMLLSLMASVCYAQSTLVATLTHGTNITSYYGSNALSSAYYDAVSGDVINLSGGTFNSVGISKGITIRGTGIDYPIPTVITGNFNINIPSDDTHKLTIEGIRFGGTTRSDITMSGSFENPTFIKCQFNWQIKFDQNAAIQNILFANCKLTDLYSMNLDGSCSAQFVNSLVTGFINSAPSTSSASFVNCILHDKGTLTAKSYANSQLINCFLCYYSPNNNGNAKTTFALPTSSKGFNCVTIHYTAPYANAQGAFVDCTSVSSYGAVFKDFTGVYSDAQTFELTDDAKTTYLGADGEQAGLYGGLLPYTSTPSYPTITKMDVAKKTSADGKLSVDIEVSAAE